MDEGSEDEEAGDELGVEELVGVSDDDDDDDDGGDGGALEGVGEGLLLLGGGGGACDDCGTDEAPDPLSPP